MNAPAPTELHDAIARIINPELFVEYDLLVEKGTLAENGKPWSWCVFGTRIERLWAKADAIITRQAASVGAEVAGEAGLLGALSLKLAEKISQLRHYRDNDCQLDHARTIAEGRILQAQMDLRWVKEALASPSRSEGISKGEVQSGGVVEAIRTLIFRGKIAHIKQSDVATIAATIGAAQAQTGCDTDHVDWDAMAEKRLGQSPVEHGRHIPQTSPAPGCDSGSHSAQAAPACGESERLRKGIQDFLDGNYPGTRRHRPNPCSHGQYWYTGCERCDEEYLTQLLKGPELPSAEHQPPICKFCDRPTLTECQSYGQATTACTFSSTHQGTPNSERNEQ